MSAQPRLALARTRPPYPGVVRSCLVLSTGPGGGATLAATALLRTLGRHGVRAVGMKPVARGRLTAAGRWHSDELQRLAAASAFGLPPRALCAHPLDGTGEAPPTLEAVVDTFRVLATWADALVVDGDSGAPFGPLALARELALPCVLAHGADPSADSAARSARMARTLVAEGIEVAGWVGVAGTASGLPGAAPAALLPGACLGTLRRDDPFPTLDLPLTMLVLAR